MRRRKSFKYNDPTLIAPSHKICYRCHISKPVAEFNRCKTGVYDLHNQCRPCQALTRKDWYNKHRDHSLEYATEYSKTPEAKEYRQKRWDTKKHILGPENNARRRTEEAKILARKQRSAWRAIPQNRIACSLRIRVRQALKKLPKLAKTEELLGCSFEFLKEYLTKLFLPSMTWDNYGEWHIDHIKPCASFDMIDPNQQRECFHYTNLQPLWAKDNLSKGSK